MKILIISIVVTLVWQQLELRMMGEVTHRKVDDVIGFILTLSLYFHVSRDMRKMSN